MVIDRRDPTTDQRRRVFCVCVFFIDIELTYSVVLFLVYSRRVQLYIYIFFFMFFSILVYHRMWNIFP